MSPLCQTVRSAVTNVFTSELGFDWTFTSCETGSCIAVSATFSIKFTIDARDRLVSSGIIFHDADLNDDEELQSHILARLFQEDGWTSNLEISDIAQSIDVEVRNVWHIVSAMRRQIVSSRDLLYFYRGYNCSYTDSVSD